MSKDIRIMNFFSVLVGLILSHSVLNSIIYPHNFYIIFNALTIDLQNPEFFLSLFILFNTSGLLLLIFDRRSGLSYNAVLFGVYSLSILLIHLIGIREFCSDTNLLMQIIGPDQFLRYTGVCFLMLYSFVNTNYKMNKP